MIKTSIPFMKYMVPLVGLAVLFTVVSIAILAFKGLNYGTDFLGGVQLQYQFSKPIGEDKVREALGSLDLPDLTIQRIGGPDDRSMALKFGFGDNPDEPHPSSKVTETLSAVFGPEGVTLRQEAMVGPKVGAELRRNALKAVIISLILILIYVGFRFNIHFAPAALICLVHDVFVTLAAISLTGREFNLTLLAAILTIIGYSVNDTIVIFDRIRENIVRYPTLDRTTVINQSLNETLKRTLFTSFTVFLAVMALYLFGGGVVHDFAFAMLVGVVAGTFSTMSLSCPFYLFLLRLFPQAEQAHR